MGFGDYTQKTFLNGSYVVPINDTNLNDISGKLEDVDNELSRSKSVNLKDYKNYFFNRNCKQIESFQDSTDWSITDASTTLSDDVASNLVGEAAVKILENDNIASFIGIDQTISSINLATFNDGSVSSTEDCIFLLVYITDYTKFTGLGLRLGDDVSNNFAIVYNPSTALTRNGWHVFFPQKKDFTTNGSPAGWDDITYIYLYGYTVTSAQNEYMSFQLLMLYREDAENDGYYNPFQKYAGSITGFENKFDIIYDGWAFYYDPTIKDIGMMYLLPYIHSLNEKSLDVYHNINNFIVKLEGYCKHADEGLSITWYYDVDNYIECYIDSGALVLNVREAGTSNYQYSTSFTLSVNERFQLFFEKDGATLRSIIKKDGQKIDILEYETTIDTDTEACLYFGHFSTNGQTFITDFLISHTENSYLDSWDIPKIVVKKSDESIDTNAVTQNDNELFCKLPPNSIFEIELNIIAVSASSVPDIRIDYTYTNLDFTTLRHVRGPATAITTTSDVPLRSSYFGMTTDISYGCVGTSNESIITEKFIVSTGINGGTIQLKWSQNVSDATPTIVEAGSYMKITKVKM